jgi:hypothetical protein
MLLISIHNAKKYIELQTDIEYLEEAQREIRSALLLNETMQGKDCIEVNLHLGTHDYSINTFGDRDLEEKLLKNINEVIAVHIKELKEMAQKLLYNKEPDFDNNNNK